MTRISISTPFFCGMPQSWSPGKKYATPNRIAYFIVGSEDLFTYFKVTRFIWTFKNVNNLYL